MKINIRQYGKGQQAEIILTIFFQTSPKIHIFLEP